MKVEQILEGIVAREGGYVDHPNDRGGPTCWGITEAVARRAGWEGPMQDLPRDLALAIYRSTYIERPGFDEVLEVSPAVGEELVDTGVNMGTGVAGEFLQRALNALNNEGRFYADLKVDGNCGHNTVAALEAYLAKRGRDGEVVLVRALNCLQGARYIAIAEKDARQEAFLFGWLAARVA